MSGARQRLALRLFALALGALGYGCGQFRVVGVGKEDLCPGQRALSREEVVSCVKDPTTSLELESEKERRGSGLEGEAPSLKDRRLPVIVALDYSGSMYGGYERKEPSQGRCGWSGTIENPVRNGPFYWQIDKFADLLREGLLAAIAPGDEVYPMVFNSWPVAFGRDEGQHVSFRSSGFEELQPIPEPVRGPQEALRKLTTVNEGTLPADPFTAPFGDAHKTHPREVLAAASTLFATKGHREGLLWLVTDNIIEDDAAGYSRRGGQDDAELNRQFYLELRNDPRWQVAFAWPIRQQTADGWLCGSTLMVYGLYYSTYLRIQQQNYDWLIQGKDSVLKTQQQVDTFKKFTSPDSPSRGEPFKLKPSHIDVVKVSFDGDVKCSEVEVGNSSQCEGNLQIENLLAHRIIEGLELELSAGRCDPHGSSGRAAVPVNFAEPICAFTVPQVAPVGTVASGVPVRRVIPFTTPQIKTRRVTLADSWQSAGVRKLLYLGQLKVAIKNLKTSTVIPREKLINVYGVEDLPELFKNPAEDHFVAGVCLRIKADNPDFRAAALVIGALGGLVFLTMVGGWLSHARSPMLKVNEQDISRLRLRRLFWAPLMIGGVQVGSAKLRLNGAAVIKARAGHRIKKVGNGWEHERADETGLVSRIQLSWKTKRQPRRRDGEF